VVSKKIKLAETDMIALYTRGIWENVDEAELDDVFAEADNEVQTTVDNIEDLLLSRQPENLDNYTLAVIFVNIPKSREAETDKKNSDDYGYCCHSGNRYRCGAVVSA
jgi:serine/threonine protein phosphatase PrpC